MNLSPEELQDLAREIACRLDPDALCDAKDAGALFKRSPRYVIDRYSKMVGFPHAIRLPTENGNKGQPLWPRKELIAWMLAHRNGASKRGGRPRNNT